MTKDIWSRCLPAFSQLVVAAIVLAAVAPPSVADESDWTGVYIGGGLGVDGRQINSTWGEVRASTPHFGAGISTFNVPIRDGVGILNLHAGYLDQWDRIVAGVEVTWGGTQLDFGDVDIDSLDTLGGRVGYTWQNLLLSVSSGLSAAEVSLNSSGSEWQDGWYFGVSSECKVTPQLSIGLEYVHHEFGTESHGGSDVGMKIEAVRIRASLHL